MISDPKALCYVQSLGVMITEAIKGALHLVDWGPLRYKAFHLPMSMHTTHKYYAPINGAFDREVFDLL